MNLISLLNIKIDYHGVTLFFVCLVFHILVQWLMYNFFLKVIIQLGLDFFLFSIVKNLYLDIEIARNGIYISRDMSDNAVGVGFVAFVSMDNAYKAIDIYDQKKN